LGVTTDAGVEFEFARACLAPTRALMNSRIAPVVLIVVALLGSFSVAAAEQADRVVRVGFVGPGSLSTVQRGTMALWERLRELGWAEGHNLIIEARWGEGRIERLPALVAEVIGRKVDVLVTAGTPTALAAKNATTTVPIVAVAMGEPLRTGLATNLARPGGNLTGLSLAWGEGVGGKWLELLQEIVPRLTAVAVIANPDNPVERETLKDLERAAANRGLKLRVIGVSEGRGLDRALGQARQQAPALLVFGDALLLANKERITAFAAQHRLPSVYVLRDFVDSGGLMAYAPDLSIQYRRAADYVDQILRGAKPGDLPIEQPARFELIVNLKTARALGLTVPESILVRADEVIR